MLLSLLINCGDSGVNSLSEALRGEERIWGKEEKSSAFPSTPGAAQGGIRWECLADPGMQGSSVR